MRLSIAALLVAYRPTISVLGTTVTVDFAESEPARTLFQILDRDTVGPGGVAAPADPGARLEAAMDRLNGIESDRSDLPDPTAAAQRAEAERAERDLVERHSAETVVATGFSTRIDRPSLVEIILIDAARRRYLLTLSKERAVEFGAVLSDAASRCPDGEAG